MARRKKAREPVAPARFKVGDKVRVKHGVKDADYRDTPLGGWAGTICEIHDDQHVHHPLEQGDARHNPSCREEAIRERRHAPGRILARRR